MPNQSIQVQLLKLRPKLRHGAPTRIANSIGENRHNVYTALRGLAGDPLTKKVLREAKRMLRSTAKKNAIRAKLNS